MKAKLVQNQIKETYLKMVKFYFIKNCLYSNMESNQHTMIQWYKFAGNDDTKCKCFFSVLIGLRSIPSLSKSRSVSIRNDLYFLLGKGFKYNTEDSDINHFHIWHFNQVITNLIIFELQITRTGYINNASK